MAVYPLHTYNKKSTTLFPNSSFYTEECAQRLCSWYLTDHLAKDDRGNNVFTYRLHSHEPRSFADFMQYDIECPRCRHRLRPVQNALNYHDLALYTCPKCNEHK